MSTARGAAMARFGPLEYSWIDGPWDQPQRLELENDLIAAFVLHERAIPALQFGIS
jgi:hypothetical protein